MTESRGIHSISFMNKLWSQTPPAMG